MSKIKLGLLLGFAAGIIDVIPMIIQKLTWDANMSAFSFWIVAGFVIAVSDMKLKGAVKGLILSLILLIPIAIRVGWQNPSDLIPILIMNILLGSALGFLIDRVSKSHSKPLAQ